MLTGNALVGCPTRSESKANNHESRRFQMSEAILAHFERSNSRRGILRVVERANARGVPRR